MATSSRAGHPATSSDLVDLVALERAYFSNIPDPSEKEQMVSFGTSGHRGSALSTSFNELHILAITQAIVEYRREQSIFGPAFVGKDTHALSKPAEQSVLEVLAGNGVEALVATTDFTPTPAVSVAIIDFNSELEPDSTARADGIIITPSHNPPKDGGIKYNPPHGGPSDTDATSWIAKRANQLLLNTSEIKRSNPNPKKYDYRQNYISQLNQVLNLELIAGSDVRIGADPMGGASVEYWAAIADEYNLDLTVVNPAVDPQFGFMTLDWDGNIRMDCSSEYSMASLIQNRSRFDISTGNDADADRHGIVTADSGLMNPNHFLAVAIHYLYANRSGWSEDAAVGKTMVSSSMIDKVVESLGRKLIEVPVGFKWFVPGLIAGTIGFGGEESAGASFLRKNGRPWSTDKDGLIMCLLAAEIEAAMGHSPSEIYSELQSKFGHPRYRRVDAAASKEQKSKLSKLSKTDIFSTTLAGEPIVDIETSAKSGGALGGVKVKTTNAWFAARPSGTEDVYKIYGESFLGDEHLEKVLAEAQLLVDSAIG